MAGRFVRGATGHGPATTDRQNRGVSSSFRSGGSWCPSCTACGAWIVRQAVKQAVSWGLAQRNLEGFEAIGVDEVQWQRGQRYQTVVYQLDEGRKRLLWIGPDRTAKTLLRFFRFLGKERSSALQFVCSDMWQAYNGAHTPCAARSIP